MNDSLIDDIVKLLDQSVTKGTGHLNIEVDRQVSNSSQSLLKKSVNTLGCSDCASGDLACQIPTLHEGVDDHSTCWQKEHRNNKASSK